MVAPGLQISEITSAIDKSIKLVIKLNEAPKEIETILKGIDHATSVLEEWQCLIEEYGDEISPAGRKFLKNTAEQYENVLTQLKKFKEKHRRLVDGKATGRLYWVVTEHFTNDRAFLENELIKMETRMSTAIHLSLNQMYKLVRSNTAPENLRQPSNILPLTEALEPAAYGGVQRSPSSPPLPRIFPDGAIAAEPEPYSPACSIFPNSISTISSSPSLSNRQDQPTIHAACGDEDHRSPGSEAFSEPTSRQPSVFSVVSPSARTSITQYSLDTPPAPFHPKILGVQSSTGDRHSVTEGNGDFPTPADSLHTSQSIQSSSATRHNSAHHRPNRRESYAQPQLETEFRGYSIFAESQSHITQCQRQNAPKPPLALNTLSRSNTHLALTPPPPPPMALPLPPQPPTALPPPLRQNMAMHCEIRIWYTMKRVENNLVTETRRNHVVKDIEIVRHSGRGASEIYLKTTEGLNVQHRRSSNISDLAQTILRPRVPPDVTRDHPKITCLLKFSGEHTFSAPTKEKPTTEKSYKVFFKGAPEYTFIDDRDNLSFQSHLTGRTLLSEDHIESITTTISSSSKLPISENRYIQLWISPTSRTLRYFCHVDRKDEFREHHIDSLRQYLPKDEAERKGNWNRVVNLKIVGDANARGKKKSPGTLRILFPPGTNKDAWVQKAGILMENG